MTRAKAKLGLAVRFLDMRSLQCKVTGEITSLEYLDVGFVFVTSDFWRPTLNGRLLPVESLESVTVLA